MIISVARFGVCRKISLCGSLCHLCASVVDLFSSNFTTETQRHRASQSLHREKLFPTDSFAGSEGKIIDVTQGGAPALTPGYYVSRLRREDFGMR